MNIAPVSLSTPCKNSSSGLGSYRFCAAKKHKDIETTDEIKSARPVKSNRLWLNISSSILLGLSTITGLNSFAKATETSGKEVNWNSQCYPARLPVEIKWPGNVKVLASVPQSDLSPFDIYRGSCYISTLCALMYDPSVDGFEAAHKKLEKEQYSVLRHNKSSNSFDYDIYFPVSTPVNLESWKKNAPKERYAILIGGHESKNSSPYNIQRFAEEVAIDFQNLKQTLKDKYNMPEEHIKTISKENIYYTDIISAILEVAPKLLESPGSELLIYYNGHGVGYYKENDAISHSGLYRRDKIEGDETGFMIVDPVNLSEDSFKYILNEFLHPDLAKNPKDPTKILIVMDTCNSGAWIN